MRIYDLMKIDENFFFNQLLQEASTWYIKLLTLGRSYPSELTEILTFSLIPLVDAFGSKSKSLSK